MSEPLVDVSEWEQVYRCRMCNEEFGYGNVVSKGGIYALCNGNTQMPHWHVGGATVTCGFADLIGARPKV